MTKSIQFGRRSTADQVLAGIDLTGKHIIVTGCNSGLGFETMNAFAANGAAVIGLARTLEAASRACALASPACIPVACDLSNFDSIAAALDAIRRLCGAARCRCRQCRRREPARPWRLAMAWRDSFSPITLAISCW